MYSSLRQLRAFRNLDDAALRALESALCSIVEAEAHTDVEREHDRSEYLYVVLSGWACRYALLPDGRRQIPLILLPGDVANLDALAGRGCYYGVSTFVRSKVALLSVSVLRQALRNHPSVASAMLDLALSEGALAGQRNVSLARYHAREQLADLLCHLASRLSADADGRYHIPLTQADFADVLGLSTVHVNRLLQGLRSEGLLQFAGSRLDILDWAGLAAAGLYRGAGIPVEARKSFGARAATVRVAGNQNAVAMLPL